MMRGNLRSALKRTKMERDVADEGGGKRETGAEGEK